MQDFAAATPGEAQLLLWATDTWSIVWQHSASDLCASLELSPSADLLAGGIMAGGLNPHIIITFYNALDGDYNRGIVDFYDALDLSFSPDGKIVAVANGYGLLYTISQTRRFVGNLLDELGSDDPTQVLKPPDESDYVLLAEFSPREPLVALGTDQGRILLWKVGDSEESLTIPADLTCAGQPRSPIRALAFSQEGTLLASVLCDDRVVVYDIQTHAVIASTTVSLPPSSIAFAPNGKVLAIGAGGMVFLWEIADTSPVCALDTAGDSATAVGFSGDSINVLAVTMQGAIAEWDARDCPDE